MTEKKSLGYTDTPRLPDSPYLVHDGARPQPRVVTPGDTPGAPPSDAVVLFDGTDLSGWQRVGGGEPGWKVADGAMEVVPKSGSIATRKHFADMQLHLEWAAPAEVRGAGQGRGNSGIFLMGLYEIQVLDGFENPTYADGITGAIYGQFPPRVNACRPPGAWQAYDIVWEAPRFDGERLVTPAAVTVLLNGVLLHHRKMLQGPTQHRALAAYAPHAATGPLQLQDHGDPVRFRNIWCRPLTDYDQA